MGHSQTWQRWWEQHAPYYRTEDKREAFERSGDEYVEQFVRELREFAPAFEPSAVLDFGCGVGRILAPLSKAFPRARLIGVDISDGALREARAHVPKAFFVNSTSEEIPGDYDLLHSFIVLQHIPVGHGLQRISELIGKLRSGGLGALHLTYANTKPWWARGYFRARGLIPGLHALTHCLRGGPVLPFTPMNCYPIDSVLRLLQASGCHRVGLRFSNHDGHLGVRLMFEKTNRPSL